MKKTIDTKMLTIIATALGVTQLVLTAVIQIRKQKEDIQRRDDLTDKIYEMLNTEHEDEEE